MSQAESERGTSERPEGTDPGDARTGPARHGVLFVHGLGEQRQSETLLWFGSPLVDWLSRWYQAQDPPPADAEVLYFDPHTRRPVAVDRITVRLPGASFSVERLLLPEGAAPFTPNPVEVPPELRQAPGALPEP